MDLTHFSPDKHFLKNRNIIITGANAGIGRNASLALAEHGATLILMGKNVEELEELYDLIEKKGGATPAIYPVNFETTVETQFQKMHDLLSKEFGHINGILHNAAILGTRAPISSYPEKKWHSVMNTNLTAPFLMTKALMPLLLNAKNAQVVFTLDDIAQQGKAFWGAYAIAKAGLKSLCDILADEHEENKNLSFNTFNPKATRTKMRIAAYPAEDPSTVKHAQALNKFYIYLLSDQMQGISGQFFEYEKVKI